MVIKALFFYLEEFMNICMDQDEKELLILGLLNEFSDQIEFTNQVFLLMKGVRFENTLVFLSDCSLILYKNGKFLHLIKCVKRCINYLEQFDKIGDFNSIKTFFIIFLSRGYSRIGDYQRGLAYNNKAMEICKDTNDDANLAMCFENYGMIYHNTGYYVKEIEYNNMALEIYERSGDNEGKSRCFGKNGIASHILGNYDKAKEYNNMALEICERSGDIVGKSNCYALYGTISYDLKDFDKAIEYNNMALEICEKTRDEHLISVCYNNLGLIFLDTKRLSQAKDFLLESLRMKEDLNDKMGMSLCYSNIGVIENMQRNVFEGIQNYQKALQIADELGDIQRIAMFSGNLGINYFVLYLSNKSEENMINNSNLNIAYKHLKTSIELREKIGWNLIEDVDKIEYFGLAADIYEIMISVCVDLGKVSEAYEYVQRSKSKSLIHLLSSSNLKIKWKTSNEKEELEINDLLNQEKVLIQHKNVAVLSIQTRAAQTIEGATNLKPGDLLEITEKLEVVYEKLGRISPEYVSLRKPVPLDLDKLLEYVNDFLQPDVHKKIVIEYFVSDLKTYIFCISSGRLIVRIVEDFNLEMLLGILNIYEKELETCERIDQSGSDVPLPNWDKWISELSESLISPISDLMTEATSVVFISHSYLHYFPLQLLEIENKPIIELLNISFLPNLSILRFLSQQENTVKTCNVFSISKEGENSFENKEAVQIANMFQTKPFYSIPKNEMIVKLKAGAIHYSSQGSFDNQNPLNSGIYLNMRLDEKEKFTSFDFLENADKVESKLMVLAACDTGKIKNKKGDELLGLVRSIFFSGTSTIVVSLWKTNSYCTMKTMIEFYTNLQNSCSKADALRKAILKTKEDLKVSGLDDHPYYWAPFVLIGDWK